MHQTMAIMLKTLLLSNSPQTQQNVLHLVDNGLVTTMHSMHSTISTTLKARPGALAFSQDMVPNVPFMAERQTISPTRETLVNNALMKTNQLCINYDYFVRQRVLKYDQTVKGKFVVKTSDPFLIVCVHINGTITIQLQLGVTERINI